VRRSDQRRAAVFALYQAEVTDRPAELLLDRDATAFTRELVDGTERDRAELDELIERYAKGWSLERNIMRVALHELLHRPDVPAEVAIDEAVEAAKELCSADAPGFVNGILGAVEREEVAS